MVEHDTVALLITCAAVHNQALCVQVCRNVLPVVELMLRSDRHWPMMPVELASQRTVRQHVKSVRSA